MTRLRRVRREVGERLYAAPDGVMYCTTEREGGTGKLRGPELKVAAIYEARPAQGWQELDQPQDGPGERLPVRTRVMRCLREQVPAVEIAAPDQASQIAYLAETGTWEQFGQRLWAELWERGLLRLAGDLAVVAEGLITLIKRSTANCACRSFS